MPFDNQGGAHEAVAQPDAVRARHTSARPRSWCSTPTTRRSSFYGGVCRRGIYDNMKTAVEAIFVGKARQYNRRFLQMCSHHLVEPVACTPASGWEKGQVENQVGNLRDQMFRPKPQGEEPGRVERLAGRSVHRLRQASHRHPEFKDRTIWEVFQDERASLMELRGPFDGFVEKAVRASDHLPDHGRPQPLQRRCTGRRPDGAGALARRAHRGSVQRRGGGRPSPPVPARPGHLRSLALSAGSAEEARRFAQRRALQGLGPAARPWPRSAPS